MAFKDPLFRGTSVAWTTDKRAVPWDIGRGVVRRHPVAKSVDLRKRELECLRLESDCRQLADAVHSPALKLHFLEMAKTWSTLAVWGLEQGYRGQALN